MGLVCQLIDMRHPPTQLDLDMVNYLSECELPFIVVLTKSDKQNKTQTAERLRLIREELPYGQDLTIIPCSAQTGEGIDELRNTICEIAGKE